MMGDNTDVSTTDEQTRRDWIPPSGERTRGYIETDRKDRLLRNLARSKGSALKQYASDLCRASVGGRGQWAGAARPARCQEETQLRSAAR
jgi:hypothetical protein